MYNVYINILILNAVYTYYVYTYYIILLFELFCLEYLTRKTIFRGCFIIYFIYYSLNLFWQETKRVWYIYQTFLSNEDKSLFHIYSVDTLFINKHNILTMNDIVIIMNINVLSIVIILIKTLCVYFTFKSTLVKCSTSITNHYKFVTRTI